MLFLIHAVFGTVQKFRSATIQSVLSTISAENLGLIVCAPRLIKKRSVFLNGPKPLSPPLPSAVFSASTSCETQPSVNHVLFVDQERISSVEDRPRIVSPTSVLCSSYLTPISKYLPDKNQLSSQLTHYYDHNAQTFSHPHKITVKPPTLLEHVTNCTGSCDFGLGYSHLICSHDIGEFGADIAYRKSASSSARRSKDSTDEPDFSFIDIIYESVKAEIFAEKACSSAQMVSSCPANVAIDVQGKPIITLAVDEPVTIVGRDGKEYKVILQAVEKKVKVPLKTKVGASVNASKVKRAPGVTLSNMTIEEINERKRKQNRAAAQRYRQKLKYVKVADKEEQDRLERRNSYLRDKAVHLQKEVDDLRKQILASLSRR